MGVINQGLMVQDQVILYNHGLAVLQTDLTLLLSVKYVLEKVIQLSLVFTEVIMVKLHKSVRFVAKLGHIALNCRY